MSKYSEIIAQFRSLTNGLRTITAGLTDEQLTTPYNQGEWTIAQNVHHLADSHMICWRRFKLILTNPEFNFTPYSVDKIAEYPDANNPNIELSIKILEGLQERWAIMMENLTEEEWQKTGMHPQNGEYSLERLAEIYGNHGQNHIKQIQEVLDAMGQISE